MVTASLPQQGNRGIVVSPDFIYRIIPIAHDGRHELRGQPTCDDPPLVRRIDVTARRERVARREAGFKRRFIDS
jgi:hypothetical protein